MKILVLTANYPGDEIPKDITPVVHYFAKEWVKDGHEVMVIHSVPSFPPMVYSFLSIFQKLLQNIYGGSFLTNKIDNKDYELEGVKVCRRIIFKLFPHLPYSKSALHNHAQEILSTLQRVRFSPDVVTIHWDRPGLNIINELQISISAKTVFIAHGVPPATSQNIAAFDCISKIGFRSEPIRRGFLQRFCLDKKDEFMCYSGIPEDLIPATVLPSSARKRVYTYVGTMVKRKHPEALIEALKTEQDYIINYIGAGALSQHLYKLAQKYDIIDKVNFRGRIARKEVCSVLSSSKCFIMISSNEAFGLVYIEAMANGCITIASKGEGMDGIIKDGINGFLCDAGNYLELRSIIQKIEEMTDDEIDKISNAARKTAYELTDRKVAKYYLSELESLCK